MKKIYLSLSILLITTLSYAQSTYEISNVSLLLKNQSYDGENGMSFAIDASFHSIKGHNVHFTGILYYKNMNGKWEKVQYSNHSNAKYTSVDYTEAVARYVKTININSSYEESYIKGNKIFIPYGAIVHPAGRVEYRLSIFLISVH